MLTFEEARQRATAQLVNDYRGPGTFYVAPWGYEDDADYLLITGAREAIEGNDPRYDVADDLQLTMDKRAGILRRTNALDNLARTWRTAGNWSQAPTEGTGDEITIS
jgi:hypothetical protein